MGFLNFILSHFFKKGKPQSRWRDLKTGRFIKRPEMFRYTLGVSHIPYGKKYYSYTYTVFSMMNFDVQQLTTRFIKLMEDSIGYDYEDWWFDFKIGYQKIIVKVETELNLIDTWEFYINETRLKGGVFVEYMLE